MQFIKVGPRRFNLALLKMYEHAPGETYISLYFNDPNDDQIDVEFDSEAEALSAATALDKIFFKTT